jgi:hypothetical protein
MTDPKYAIGDRLPDTGFIVRGVMTDSNGFHRYFLQIKDNSIVIEENALDLVLSIAVKISA